MRGKLEESARMMLNTNDIHETEVQARMSFRKFTHENMSTLIFKIFKTKNFYQHEN